MPSAVTLSATAGIGKELSLTIGSGSGTVRLTAGQALVRYLAAQHSERDGVRRRLIPAMFGIFGHGNVCGVGQALEQETGLMPYYQPKNEQAMVHTAIGFAKANRRLSTLACTASIGPGSTNMITGAATATVNRIPVLLLPSDTFASRLQGPPMQSLDDQFAADVSVNDCFRPVSRFFDRVSRPEQLLASLPQAIRTLVDPEHTGAVTIAIHQDVQAEAYNYPAQFFAERTWHISRRPGARSEIDAAVALLESAERPLVIAGGGVHYSDASDALARFADLVTAPVAETSAGKGVHPVGELAVGAIGHSGTRAANALARQADLVVCIGTRLIDLTTGSNTLFEDLNVRFIGINLAPGDATKLGGLPVLADAREALLALSDALEARPDTRTARAEWRSQIQREKSTWSVDLNADLMPRAGEAMSQAQVLRTLNQRLGSSDSLIVASGTPHVDIHKLWDAGTGTRIFMEVGFSCMGHEIPAALGVRMACGPQGEVYAVIGDGTYLMGSSELVTAVQEQLKITVLVIENHGYQSIHALQRARIGTSFGLEFRARSNGSRPGLRGPYVDIDLAANAASYGCDAYTASSLVELEQALSATAEGSRPAVIVAKVEPCRLMLDSRCWWDVGVPHVAQRAETLEAVATSDAGRQAQRYFG
jgi:3D-(3,5/4)-trihydroxycyclohexane-1,2-dione acylhydrolase (decyclizing)